MVRVRDRVRVRAGAGARVEVRTKVRAGCQSYLSLSSAATTCSATRGLVRQAVAPSWRSCAASARRECGSSTASGALVRLGFRLRVRVRVR